MIPAFSNPQGRDSFGRGLDEASVRAAIHTNSRVMHEREEQLAYVEAAYRDPRRAKQRLDELVARDGPLSAARRITAEPTTLGELQGRTGLLAGAAARAERARAEIVADALADNVRRVAEAEALAEHAYRRSVEEQRRADAVHHSSAVGAGACGSAGDRVGARPDRSSRSLRGAPGRPRSPQGGARVHSGRGETVRRGRRTGDHARRGASGRLQVSIGRTSAPGRPRPRGPCAA